MTLSLRKIEEAAEAATPGPWQVVIEKHPHRLGGKHTERRIFTTWDHPQLKGPLGVVNTSIGLGEAEGSPARHMVAIGATDAAHIAAMDPATVLKLVAAVRAARESNEYHARLAGICRTELSRQDAALREALNGIEE